MGWQQRTHRHTQGGFTLLEVVITVVIMGLLLALTVQGLPVVRRGQQLTTAVQQIQSVVREAQQRAFNETREPDCLSDTRAAEPKYCSDIGLFFEGSALTMYADLDQSRTFSATGDYVIQHHLLSPSVTTTAAQEFVFAGSPPELDLIVNGTSVTEGQLTVQVGSHSADITISRYGHVQRVP